MEESTVQTLKGAELLMQPRVWQVTGFETRVCAEGQVGITVVCSKIEYAGDAPAGRPSW